MEILCTKNYDLFKAYGLNRTVASTKKLQKSISIIDMTPYVPIVVTSDFRIIDGQHRFEVCKQLNKPIHYVVFKGDAEKAMVNLNTSSSLWKQSEWQQYYIAKEYPAYLAFDNFMKENKAITISNAIVIFSDGKTNSKDFKDGKLIDESNGSDRVVSFLNDELVDQRFRKYRPFVSAVNRFVRAHSTKECNKVLKNLWKITTKSAEADDYLRAFEKMI